ncbi:MAG: aminotransferase class I/II-fold pyridoxal phosphate-dependent enzyme [Flavobacteriales bacterium]|nr:aminotransferase class I/II-fold pyridoxal phosphate-dependent enzyme [Flavobacteriales bacterium]MBK7246562.1 aminotransferase class I/II-fold pyridoxal phosphate-dependent enzyme [Flavobacteriales bacterium]HQV40351.1 aminotransferase class I/II-fold pyridoxal phosphate-dependent enzyme [Flavobacteriales bacterium]HQY01553.1 aminotransferase class I/II-fold pyridoxal phosphate-dependent enzyme [Flavobacteriales bacterium]HQY79081.1 aminotransferase class I/II-fold pyridoxal phosphate-depen
MKPDDLSYILNHLGEDREAGYNAVVPPIAQSGNFTYPTVEALRNAMRNEFDVPLYTRGVNPTVAIVRKKLAALEHAEDALLFSSGSAAIAAGVMSFVKAGDHIVCVKKPYSWTTKLLSELLVRFNVSTTYVDGTDAENFRKAITPETRLFILESPNSIIFELQDLSAVAAIAKAHGILTLCDNSYNSPLFQNPIDLGIDLVAHSGTKYLNGHSDVVCGVLAGSKEHIRQVMAKEFMTLGAAPSPHDAWLLMRGLRTLELRVHRSADSAERVANFLEAHPKVSQVNWPFLKSFPQEPLARKQMKRCAGLMSIRVKAADIAGVERFCNGLQRFLLAVSWGGYESLQFPTAAVIGPGMPQGELPWDLVRIYVGLEDPEALIADLEQALALV